MTSCWSGPTLGRSSTMRPLVCGVQSTAADAAAAVFCGVTRVGAAAETTSPARTKTGTTSKPRDNAMEHPSLKMASKARLR